MISHSIPPGAGAVNGNTLSAAEKQAILADEKRRKRRESHNAVERRRRDNINERIGELATLIPDCLLDIGAPSHGTSLGAGTGTMSPTLASSSGVNGVNGNGQSSPASPPVAIPAHITESPGSIDREEPRSPSSGPDATLSSSPPSFGGTKHSHTAGENVSCSGPGGGASNGFGGGGGNGVTAKANKGMILRKSVEYIRYLQQLVEAQGARNRQLEAELRTWRTGGGGQLSVGQEVTMPGGPSDGGVGLIGIGTGVGCGGGGFFTLPSMPEGDSEAKNEEEDLDEDGEEDDMDVIDDAAPLPVETALSVAERRGRTSLRGCDGDRLGVGAGAGMLGSNSHSSTTHGSSGPFATSPLRTGGATALGSHPPVKEEETGMACQWTASATSVGGRERGMMALS